MALAIHQSNNPAAMMALAPANSQMPNQLVSIGELLDLAINKTYHELINLAELLPRKIDMDRKIDIIQFANRHRQLYVRLLGLVKWASSASKVEKCSQIMSFLDKQSMLFTETADILARLSRETLASARLPSFQLLAAVEVMTLGTYSRLPSCIRDRLVPPEPIPNSDKRAALLQLNHIIQQRLVTSELPLQMRNIKIEFGRVTFTVQNEFKLTLTLMGDNPNIPWRVLNVKILVEDKEISNVRDLVQPVQIYYLQNLIQSRLADNPKPLVEAYNILHSFCLSLQLEVLHIQSYNLFYERLKDFTRLDEYNPGNRITISYWKDQDDKTKYKLIIEIDSQKPSKPLQIRHVPELNSKVFANSMQANILSIEKILFFTTHERSKIKLNSLAKVLEKEVLSLTCELCELPAVLHVSFIDPCMASEQLLICIDMLTGQFLVHIPQYEECPLISEIETCLNKNLDKLPALIKDLRIWITRERFKKTIEALPVHILDTLPFPPNYTHPIMEIEGHKIYFQFTRHHDKCLMVVFNNDKNSKIWTEYYLLNLAKVGIECKIPINNNFNQESPKHYMQILKVLNLDSTNILHNLNYEEYSSEGSKRKVASVQSAKKRLKLPGYYITDLAHVVNFCEEKLSYSCLSTELHKKQIHHQVVQDLNGYTHYIDIIKFPNCAWCPSNLTDNIQANTLSCTIRLHGKSSKLWAQVLIAFANQPVLDMPVKEQCMRKIVSNTYDYTTGSPMVIVKMVNELLLDWTAIARLYDVVQTFVNDLKASQQFNSAQFEVKSFSYKKICISYGQSKAYFVTIYYKSQEKRFQLSFGVSNQALSNTNPHIIVATQLQQEFNHHLSIIQLLNVLNYTLNPLLTIQNLKSIPLLGVINSRPNVPVLSFCVIPQSSTHIRLIYRNTYCLDIVIHLDNLVAIRDGALSQFDTSKVINDLTPIQGLKAFLSKFIDKNVQMRRLSQTEDDNPPSPISQVEFHDNYMFPGTQIKTSPIKTNVQMENRGGGGGGGGNQGMPSNPHTPASPMGSVFNPHQSNFVGSPGTFSLSSPPSLPGHQNQSGQVVPSPQMHHEQSPAGIFNINSPINPNLHAQSPSFLPTPSPSNNFSHTQSPASQFLSQNTPQGSVHETGIGSPFNQPSLPNPQSNMSLSSPATNIWPASPSVSRPSPRPLGPSQSPGGPNFAMNHHGQNVQHPQFAHSNVHPIQQRFLPQKAWAAALPTLLSHQGFEMMCRPNSFNDTAQCTNLYYSYSQLERFLGATFMRRNLLKPIEEHFKILQTMDQGVVFQNETMQFKIAMDTSTMQSIHLWVTSLSEMSQWSREEMDILQQFFENKVACAPYKPNAFYTFSRLLAVPLRILKDFIRIMRLELYPDQTLKWSVQFCLTIPPYGITMTGPGMSACVLLKNKILIFLQLTRNPVQGQMMAEPLSVILPVMYDMNGNVINVISNERSQSSAHVAILNMINNQIRRFLDFNPDNVECVIFPVVREIMANLQIPG